MIRPNPLLLVVPLLACGGPGAPGRATPTPKSYAQNLLGGLATASIERTRGDMLAIATAIGAYGAAHGDLPPVGDFEGLARVLTPSFMRVVPRNDAWGRPFVFQRGADGWALISPGPDALTGTDDDTVLSDRGFVKLPKGYDPNFTR